ncbi:MAG TPA: SPW repeat protein [Microbacteriaceae bacterium]|nr:SPW repeat protein [Microbacteriaceae bacterium]
MRRWIWRKYFIAVAAGLAAALSSTLVNRGADITMLVMAALGLLIALFGFIGVFAILEPRLGPSGLPVALFGVLLFLAPWVMGYVPHAGQAWTSWVCGLVGLLVGLWGIAGTRGKPLPPRTQPRRDRGSRRPAAA